MDDLRIQIVNYKTKTYLIECLGSVFADLEDAPGITFRVAILDNASGDDISDMKSIFPGKDIDVKKSERNLGFGGGHNILAKERTGRYLALLNPDTRIIEPRTFARLKESIERHSADVLGPRLVTDAGRTQRWDHGELKGFIAAIAESRGRSYWKKRREPLPVAWVSGAVFLIGADDFDDIGGFDEHFFLYKEEEDLCLRLRRKGKTVWYDPGIAVLHHGSVVAKKSEHMGSSRAYFMKKHFGG